MGQERRQYQEDFKRLVVTENLTGTSYRDLRKKHGITPGLISGWMKRYGVEVKKSLKANGSHPSPSNGNGTHAKASHSMGISTTPEPYLLRFISRSGEPEEHSYPTEETALASFLSAAQAGSSNVQLYKQVPVEVSMEVKIKREETVHAGN